MSAPSANGGSTPGLGECDPRDGSHVFLLLKDGTSEGKPCECGQTSMPRAFPPVPTDGWTIRMTPLGKSR
jgi:hypothetical protein